jgi:HAMP domain-containing protein
MCSTVILQIFSFKGKPTEDEIKALEGEISKQVSELSFFSVDHKNHVIG